MLLFLISFGWGWGLAAQEKHLPSRPAVLQVMWVRVLVHFWEDALVADEPRARLRANLRHWPPTDERGSKGRCGDDPRGSPEVADHQAPPRLDPVIIPSADIGLERGFSLEGAPLLDGEPIVIRRPPWEPCSHLRPS